MICPKCDGPTTHSETDLDYSKQTGIRDLELLGVDTYTCSACKQSFYELGDNDHINDEIAKLLLSKKILTKSEIKFAQEQLFEESIFEFADRLKTRPQILKLLYTGPDKNIHCRQLTQTVQDELFKKFTQRSIKISF